MKKILSLIIANLFIALSFTGCSFFSKEDKSNENEINTNEVDTNEINTKELAESYEAVDSSLNSVLSSEEYDKANLNTKRELVLQTLNSSECENYIKSDSIKTDDFNYVTFNFLNGTECIVELNEEQEYGTIGGMPSYSDYWFKNNKGSLTTEQIERIPWQIADMKLPYNENDKKALLIDGAGYTDVSYNLEENAKEWSKCHLNTTHEYNFTVADYKTRLSDYDYVNIYCHGIFVQNTPRIQTDEEVSIEKDIEYCTDMTTGRVALLYSHSQEAYVINPDFFSHYYKKNKLENTIIWLSSCHGLENDKLAEAFKAAGVKFLIGADGINKTTYDQFLQIDFVYYLFTGKEAYQALTLAKDNYKQLWSDTMEGVNIKPYTTNMAYLFTLKDDAKEKWDKASTVDISTVVGYVTDMAGNPIEGANVCPAYNINGEWQNANSVFTDENGRYSFELKNNNYKIFVKADRYIDFESGEYEIEAIMDAEGDTFEYIVDTIKLEEKLVVPDIVQTVFDNTELWHKEIVDNSPYYDEREEYFWFQDIDMDGTVEFITGPAISGAHACHSFYIWKIENNQIQKVPYIYNSGYQENALMLWHNYSELIDFDYPSPIDSFMLKLFKNTENGHFEYIYTTQDGDAIGNLASIYEFDCATKQTKEIFSISTGPNFTEYLVNNNVVLEEDFKEEYNKYISKLQLYDTSVIQLNYYDYSSMSDEQKKEMLLTSYKAWQYSESNKSINLGMNSVVAEIKNSSSGLNEEYPLFIGIVNTEKDPLNVRKSPSVNAEIIGKVDKGTAVDVYSEADGWCEIRYNGQVGYVSKEFINCEIGGYAKPVIYLYPNEKTDVSVKINFKNGRFTCTYPDYNNGWNVTAYPDGKIINKDDNDEYSYLYWEGEGQINYDFSSGFVVKREDTAKFLKEKLSYMGLTPKEYNEFIVYWLPIMQENEYNLVSFQMGNYDDSAKLNITPEPDSILRVFMAFKEADDKTTVPQQKLEKFERKGFTVIEWGGVKVK